MTTQAESELSNPYAGIRFVSADTIIVMQYLFVIYDHPRDYPDAYVVRRWVIGDGAPKPTTDMQTAPTIEAVRAMVPAGYERLPRTPDQDAAIMEVWI